MNKQVEKYSLVPNRPRKILTMVWPFSFFLKMSWWSDPFAISNILRRSNNISSMYNDNIIYLSRLFLVFSSSRAFLSQNNVHAPLFKILIFSMAAARAFGSSQMRQQTSLMFFFSGWYAYLTPNVRCGHSAGNDSVRTHYILKMDYSTLLLILS